MPVISTYGIVNYPLVYGGLVGRSFDQGWSEFLGGQGLYFRITNFSKVNQVMQNRSLKVYLLLFVLWFIFLLGVMSF